MAVKHVVTAHILLMSAYVTLSPGPARRDTTAIYAGAALFGLFLWTLDALADSFVFPREGQTLWSIEVHGAGANGTLPSNNNGDNP